MVSTNFSLIPVKELEIQKQKADTSDRVHIINNNSKALISLKFLFWEGLA